MVFFIGKICFKEYSLLGGACRIPVNCGASIDYARGSRIRDKPSVKANLKKVGGRPEMTRAGGNGVDRLRVIFCE